MSLSVVGLLLRLTTCTAALQGDEALRRTAVRVVIARPMLAGRRMRVVGVPVAKAVEDVSAPGRAAIWAAWSSYIGIVLLSEGGIAPGASALHTEPETISEALGLSLNFWFVLPFLAPQVAPSLSPALEALFNVIVSWALLFFGFISDEKEKEYGPAGMLPYLVGGLFLTNVFYLPMLAVRTPRPVLKAQPSSPLQEVVETRAFSGVLGLLPIIAVLWGSFGRPDLASGVAERWAELVRLVETDRLAFSFASDALVFAVFQGALVQADATRRGADGDEWRAFRLAARVVPYYGLVLWMLTRPPLSPPFSPPSRR